MSLRLQKLRSRLCKWKFHYFHKMFNEAVTAEKNMPLPIKERFLLQHVWKTGGREFCYLVKANGWKTPPNDCRLDVHQGWPLEDYDMIANESPILRAQDGKIRVNFNDPTAPEHEVQNVKWITILRHPYSRSLSHYYHVLSDNQTDSFTLPEFLTDYAMYPLFYPFHQFIPNQQTRWHCGTRNCTYPYLGPEHLADAMSVLEQFHVVLILEDMKDPNSCTRLQMRHVLNLTQFEVLEDLNKTNSTEHLEYTLRRPSTSWYKEIYPQLLGLDKTENGRSVWANGSQKIMAALGLHNDIDLQLYGYGRKLCTERAAAIQSNTAATIQSSQNQHHLLAQSVTSNTSWSHVSVESDWSESAAPSLSIITMPLSCASIFFLWVVLFPPIRRLRIVRLYRKCTNQ